ncbi:serine hydrolase domain-containing protein [Algoriphagus halophilus]|uniref:serine hydrolase domain-containing protein n=1 Tax=Algoriphagus halophilus TaxID=226505 RepID=UPI00358E7F5F
MIEKVSGQSYSDFTKENILEPLGMLNSGWFYSDIDYHAVLYDEKDNSLKPYTLITYPDGGFKTTITDLSKYLIQIIKGYNGNSSLLTKESWSELFRKNFNTDVENIDEKEPNTGLFMVYFKSGKIGHTGSDPGVSCIMIFDPISNSGKIFMANEDITKENLTEFKKIWGI